MPSRERIGSDMTPQTTGIAVTANTTARNTSGKRYLRRRFASGNAARAHDTANVPPESTGVGSAGMGCMGELMNRDAKCLRGGVCVAEFLISRVAEGAGMFAGGCILSAVGKGLSLYASESNMSRARTGVSGTGESGEGGTSVWARARTDPARKLERVKGSGRAEEVDPALARPQSLLGERALVQ